MGRPPFAAASGASPRMLIYHFGTRDELLRETLKRARQRQRDYFGALLSPRAGEPYVSTLRRAWQVMTGPAGRPYLSMFGRLREDAEQRLWPGFRRESTTDWLQPLEDGMRQHRPSRPVHPRTCGLPRFIMDIETTGDASRADRAFEEFLTVLGLLSTRTKHRVPGTGHPAGTGTS